ncbi:MAG: diheme cytochrome c-553 [Candidatus Contendobacter sp.]|nr:diheme cytochrome c-553 [Candidatus Contendobacter sp.]MDS4060502.1 diheme cytochrome c-553 [Candidatus Contendobacter sp.]
MRQVVVPSYLEAVRPSRKTSRAAGFLTLGVFGLGVANGPALAASGDDLTARGAYLVTGFGCADCHTPMKMGPKGPEPDSSRQLSGHPENLKLSPPPKADGTWIWFGAATNTAYAGPWGISYAINLTPDKETGLGNWKEEDFVQAIKTGKHAGVGRPIMPPMPWLAMSHLSEDDLRAMFRYLQTLPPIRNRAPDYQPPAPG